MISEEVFKELETSLAMKGMTGNLYGTLDAFLFRLIEVIKEKKIIIILNLKRRNRNKK